MKLKYGIFAIACVMALSLTGCFAGRDDDGSGSAPVEPTNTVPSDYASYPPSADLDGAGNSAGPDDVRNSAGVENGNDAMEGGGAGGTNDRDNNGLPDETSIEDYTGNAADDIGDAAGDLARGAGDLARGDRKASCRERVCLSV